MRTQHLLTVLIKVFHQQTLQLIDVCSLFPESLLNDQTDILQSIFRHLCPSGIYHRIRHRFANHHHFHFTVVFLVSYRFIQYLRIRERQLTDNELMDTIIEVAAANKIITQIDTGNNRKQHNSTHIAGHLLLSLFIQKDFLRIFQQTNHQVCCQTDKDRVNKEEIEGPEEIIEITTCQAKTCRTQRRHQSRGNRYSRNHISFTLSRAGNNTSQTTKEGNQYVIDGRLCTGKQFTLGFADG